MAFGKKEEMRQVVLGLVFLLLFLNAADSVSAVAGDVWVVPARVPTITSSANSSQVIVDYFVMSNCPNSNNLEKNLIKPLYDSLGGRVKINPHYFVYSDWPVFSEGCVTHRGRTLCALHGREQIQQDMREMCVLRHYNQKKYYDFVLEINEKCDRRNISLCWKNVSKGLRIDSRVIENCVKTNGPGMLVADFENYQKFNVRGAPTILINGEVFNGPMSYEQLLWKVCLKMDRKKLPDVCKSWVQQS